MHVLAAESDADDRHEQGALPVQSASVAQVS